MKMDWNELKILIHFNSFEQNMENSFEKNSITSFQSLYYGMSYVID